MLYACDDHNLVWADAYGLSRLASSRIKTLPQGSAHIFSTLSMDQDRQTLMLYDAPRSEAIFYTYPELERLKRLRDLPTLLELRYDPDISSIHLHPQGNAIFIWQDAAIDEDGSRGLLAYNDETDQEAFYPLDWEDFPTSDATSRPTTPRHLGPAIPAHMRSVTPLLSPFAISPDGTFIAYAHSQGLLFGGTWPVAGAPPTLLWKLPFTIYPRFHATLTAHPDGCLVALYDQSRYNLHLLHIDPYGLSTPMQVPARSLPAFSGQTLAYQRDIETLVEFDWPSQSLEEHKLPPKVVGTGRLMLGEHNLFFLPDHGEFLYDVRNKKRRQRRLPTQDEDLRAHFRTLSRRYERLGKTGKMKVQLDHLLRKDLTHGPVMHYHLSAFGENNELLSGYAFYALEDELEHRFPTWLQARDIRLEEGTVQFWDSRQTLSASAITETLSVDQQFTLFQYFEQANMDIMDVAPFLSDLYDARMGYPSSGASIPTENQGPPLMFPMSEIVWLQVLACAIHAPKGALRFGLESEKHTPTLDREAYIASLIPALQCAPPPRLDQSIGALLRLAHAHMGPQATTLIYAILAIPDDPLTATCYLATAVLALRLAYAYPHTLAPLREAFAEWRAQCLHQDALLTVEQVVQLPEQLERYARRRPTS